MIIHQGHVDHAADFITRISVGHSVAQHFRPAAKARGIGLVGDHPQGPALGRFPIQRSLRAAQGFNTLDIDEPGIRVDPRRGDGLFVQIDRGGGTVAEAEPLGRTTPHEQRIRPRGAVDHIQAGDLTDVIVEGAQVLAGDGVGADGRNGQGNILEVEGAFGGGHHHFFQCLLLGLGHGHAGGGCRNGQTQGMLRPFAL